MRRRSSALLPLRLLAAWRATLAAVMRFVEEDLDQRAASGSR
jgi:hypothetical protein